MSLLSHRPLSDSFTIVWKNDPALDPARLDQEHADDPQKPDFADAYKRALETQDWSPLLKGTESPTVFTFRLLVGTTGKRIRDMVGSGAIGNIEGLGVVFRMACIGIAGWGPPLPQFKRDNDRQYPQLGEMLSAECYAALCKCVGDQLDVDLASIVLNRSSNLLPLS